MTSPEVSATAAAESGDTPEGAPAPIIMEGVPGVEGKPPPLLFRSPAGRGEAAAGSEREGGGSGSPRSRCTSASSWRGGDVCGGNVRVASTGVRTSWWLCERRWLASIYLCLYSLPPHHTHLCQLLLHVACPQLQSPALALQAARLRNLPHTPHYITPGPAVAACRVPPAPKPPARAPGGLAPKPTGSAVAPEPSAAHSGWIGNPAPCMAEVWG